MMPWRTRPREEAHLLNPAFCCANLAAAAIGYDGTAQTGLPFPLAFMVLPIVLHKPTRDALPRSTTTSLAAWIQENATARVQFYERLMSLKPYTREAVQFGLLFDWLAMRAGGRIQSVVDENMMNRSTRTLTDDARECVMRSRLLGKWFAAAGPASTVMALWGIRP